MSKQVVPTDLWSIACNENTLIVVAFAYGISWSGSKDLLDKPLTSLLIGTFLYAPISLICTGLIADVLPKPTHGFLTVLLTTSTIRCLLK